MSDISLQTALQGIPGALDAWLEIHSEAEVRAAILALVSPQETLRDKFAAKCVAAMVSTIRGDDDYVRARKIAEYHGMEHLSDWFAHDAYKQADAMLRTREVQP